MERKRIVLVLPEHTGAPAPGTTATALRRPADAVLRAAAALDAPPDDVLFAALTLLADRYRQHWNRRLRAAAPAPARVATATRLRDLLPAAGTPHEAEEEAAAPLVRAGAALDPRTDDLAVRMAGRALVLEANPASFGPDTLRGIGDHLDAVLDQCAAGRALADVDMLTDGEREFLERHGGRSRDYPATTLHELVARQARRTPDAVALSHGEQRLGYRRLDRAANTVAHRLAELGVGPGTLVAVAGGRCLELFVALLGVLKAGGAIVHLDPAQPDAYHRSVVEAAGLRIVVVAPGGAVPAAAGSALAELPVHGILAEAEHADTPPGGEDSGNPEHPGKGAGPEDPAYVIFTSGTTGRPKGVVRPHRMHTSRIDLEQSMYGLGPSDRVLLKSAVSFREFLWPLAVGARAVIAREGGDRDDRYLLSLMREERLTVVSFVPSMLRLLAADPAFAELDALRHIFVGGEKFPRDLEQRLIAQGHAVHNTYTLTEADYVLHRRGPTDQPGTGSVAGRALDMRVYLCDPDGRRVPPGVVGEIRTGGPGLATGYLDQPAETARRFVPNPFEGPPGAAGGAPLLFRTGDLARFLPNGEVEYIGRADLQVKIRGLRVEPTAVEAVLREHPDVADAAVVGYPDPDQGFRLFGFVRPEPDGTSVESLRAFLAERTPPHTIPAHFVLLDRLPLLPSGKTDRAALVPVPGDRPPLRVPYVPPRTDAERRVAAQWSRALGLDRVGRDDDFAGLGGDSLRLLVLRSLLEQEFGAAVEVADLFDRPTVGVQAELFTRRGPDATASDGAAAPDRGPEQDGTPTRGRAAAQARHREQQRRRAALGGVPAPAPARLPAADSEQAAESEQPAAPEQAVESGQVPAPDQVPASGQASAQAPASASAPAQASASASASASAPDQASAPAPGRRADRGQAPREGKPA
ncbi:non-ribosomal peptide synthetase [Streptomyces varsoviensis]|uniref:non-ribosomal peptide synthetase n=1 Tax=Streptomyces varsoviensis TaxID=67373 RepID=UPI0033F4BB63